MSTKTFTIAGYSTLGGREKLRVANGSVARRITVLKSAGHTDISFQELPNPMTRAEAGVYISNQNQPVFVSKMGPPPRVLADQLLDVVFEPEMAA